MRTIRPFLPLIVVALFVAACAGSTSAPGAARDVGAGGSATAGEPANPAPAQGIDGQTAYRDDAKIIRTGSITLEVSDIASALRVARDAIIALGGYVGASTTSNESDRPTAEITYRIPADQWERALDTLRGLNGLTTKVVAEHTEAVEVTGQVIDLEARIANLRASESALQAIAAKATKITDVLEVQAQLTETRGQIETLTAQLKDLNDRSAYATLTAQFNVPIVAVDVATKGWDPGAVVDEAAAAMVSVLQGLATGGIWFAIVWLPILIVVGVLSLIVIAVARRLGVGRRSRDDVPPVAPVTGDA
jgi:Domain of unknown function (DUF4349)